jgi:UDP-glucuronate decarboxylase
MISSPIFQDDVSGVVDALPTECSLLVNRNVLVTGASGFVATWLVATWLESSARFGGSGRLILTCRNPEVLILRHPRLVLNPMVEVRAADIRTLKKSHYDKIDLVLHAATAASESLNVSAPLEMMDVIVSGTRNVLGEFVTSEATKIVFLSSGAVYGESHESTDGFGEDCRFGPDLSNIRNAYHEAKRLAELMVRVHSSKLGAQHVSLRLFTFLAPFLPLDTHFAAGNFLLNAIRGEDIIVKSGGESVRSYQYGSDLTKYIVCAMTRDLKHSVYNVGSPHKVSIRELAQITRDKLNPSGKIRIVGVDNPDNCTSYFPNVSRLTSELGFEDDIGLEEAIVRTSKWYLDSIENVF